MPMSVLNEFYDLQKIELIKTVEKMIFRMDDEKQLFAKQELLAQINSLDISINVMSLFTINRRFLAGVSHLILVCKIYIIRD